MLAELGLTLPLDRPARRLSVAEQQLVEIAKALVRRARLIVMDEPTAALTEREIDGLFALNERLRAQGVAFVYISHRLEELPRISQRITVIRDGRSIATKPTAEMPQAEMIRFMVGREVSAQFPELPPVAADGARRTLGARARVRGRSAHRGNLRSTCARGRSSGSPDSSARDARRSCARSRAPTSPTRAEIRVGGDVVRVHSPRAAIDAGIALVTEDRKAQGLVLGMNVRENTTLAHLGRFTRAASSIARARRRRRTRRSRACASARRARSRRRAISRAATSRRSCSRSGSSARRASTSSTSPRAGSTSARKPRSTH